MTMTAVGALLCMACMLPVMFLVCFGPGLYLRWWAREKKRRCYRWLSSGQWVVGSEEK